MELRPYQIEAVTQIRTWAAAGGKGAILQMSTGAGKTACLSNILIGARNKGKRGVLIVRGKQLIFQGSERLTREGVPHGIYQADKTRDTNERILVCSVDTLFARKIAPPADVVVIDEVHQATSEGYRWVLDQYPNAFKLGVSATPHARKGLRHVGDRLVRPIDISELIAKGYLVGARYFVPYIPNMRGVAKSGGDFNTKELGKRALEDEELTASAKGVWSKNLRGKSTLVFAVSVEHARVLLDGLRESGARGEIIVANTPDGERRDYIRKLEDGRLDLLVSVGVLTVGVDIPPLKAILCCRPTESYNLWIQILGRGTRPAPGKANFLVYDLSGNLQKHGPIEAEAIASLDGMPEVPKVKLKTCPACFACFESAPLCPSCGADCTETRDRTTGTRIHGLTENSETVEVKVEAWELRIPELVTIAREKQYRKGWIYNQLRHEFGAETSDKAWPRIRAIKKWPTKNQGTGMTPKRFRDELKPYKP